MSLVQGSLWGSFMGSHSPFPMEEGGMVCRDSITLCESLNQIYLERAQEIAITPGFDAVPALTSLDAVELNPFGSVLSMDLHQAFPGALGTAASTGTGEMLQELSSCLGWAAACHRMGIGIA